jgi:hypothetical protein
MGFELIGGEIAEGGTPSFSVVINEVVVDF